MPEESEPVAINFSDWLIPEAFAQEVERLYWSLEERELVAILMRRAAENIENAIERNDVEEVGNVGSEFRLYVEFARQVALWFSHVLAPNTFVDCPQGHERFCNETIPFWIWWGDGGMGGLNFGVNAIEVSQRFSPLSDTTISIVAHEATHSVTRWLFPSSTFSSEERVLRAYMDESTAFIVEAIIMHFLDSVACRNSCMNDSAPAFCDTICSRTSGLSFCPPPETEGSGGGSGGGDSGGTGDSGGGSGGSSEGDTLTDCRRGVLDLVSDGLWPFLGEVCVDGSGNYVAGGPRDDDWVGCRADGTVGTGWGVAPNPYGALITGGNAFLWGISYGSNDGYYCSYNCSLGTDLGGFLACWCAPDLEAVLGGRCRYGGFL